MRNPTDIIDIHLPRTFFGAGAVARLPELMETFGASKVLVVTDANLLAAKAVEPILGSLREAKVEADVFADTKPEAPVSTILELVRRVREGDYQLLIAVGGGSTMDTTKAAASLAANPDASPQDFIDCRRFPKKVPFIAVPTTAGTGSEWSAMAVIHNDVGDDVHYPCMNTNNVPNAAIIDPTLTSRVPPAITADTGMDALAHAIEAYTSPNASVFSDMLAAFAIRAVAGSLRRAYAKGERYIEDRYHMSIGAASAMLAMSMTGPGLAHLGNETLGAMARIPHGRATGLLLPAVMSFNLITDPRRFADIAGFMGENTCGLSTFEAAELAICAVQRLLQDLGMPRTLGEVGVGVDQISTLARELAETRRPVITLAGCRSITTEQATELYRGLL